jgi:methanogenic corrinoid protein MtbC1
MANVGAPEHRLQQSSTGVGSSKSKRSKTSELECSPASPPAKDTRTLAQLIETTIIPRLVEGHDSSHTEAMALDGNVLDFTDAILDYEATPSLTYFASMLERGVPLDTLFQYLLVPAALRLGEMWEKDARDFVEVARGMDHIHQIILAHSTAFCTDGRVSDAQRRILLVALPQERHRLGLCLVRADFWREGWDVCCNELQFFGDLESLVADTHYDAVGISAGRVGDAPMLARSLAKARKSSRNRKLLFIGGGLAFQHDQTLASAIGCDATASSGREAAAILRRMLDAAAAAGAT